MAVGSISSDILIEKGDLCYCLQCPTYFEWEKYHREYELMDYFLCLCGNHTVMRIVVQMMQYLVFDGTFAWHTVTS